MFSLPHWLRHPWKSKQCSIFRGSIIPYIEGSLGEKETHSLEAHLKVCTRCRKELLSSKRLYAAIDALREEDAREAPSGAYWANFNVRLQRRIAQSRERKSPVTRLSHHLYYLVPVSAVLLLALAGVFRLRRTETTWNMFDNSELKHAAQFTFSTISETELVSYLDEEGIDAMKFDLYRDLEEKGKARDIEQMVKQWDGFIGEVVPDVELQQQEIKEVIEGFPRMKEYEDRLYDLLDSVDADERERFLNDLRESPIITFQHDKECLSA
jgi:hypothetical protein